ncbi:MAG: radical SAM protein [Pseudomonadota bacterium]
MLSSRDSPLASYHAYAIPIVAMKALKIDTLRISVTDYCNLNCLYCSPNKREKQISDDYLSWDELYEIVGEFSKHGIHRVKITGGEPFCREGLVDFIGQLKKLPLTDISITTNGTLARPYLKDLYAAGLKRITFSLDALCEKIYRELSGQDLLGDVWGSVEEALKIGFSPIKLNTVIIKGVNESEIVKLSKLTTAHKINLRFIELMQQGESDEEWSRRFISSDEIKKILISEFGELMSSIRSNDGTHVKVFRIPEALGSIGFISPNSDKFCDDCAKLRLTSKGVAKTCLRSSEVVDLKKMIGNKRLLSQGVESIVSLKRDQLQRIRDKLEEPKRICHPMKEVGG